VAFVLVVAMMTKNVDAAGDPPNLMIAVNEGLRSGWLCGVQMLVALWCSDCGDLVRAYISTSKPLARNATVRQRGDEEMFLRIQHNSA